MQQGDGNRVKVARVKVVIDMLGGDFGLTPNLKGSLQALQQDDELDLLVVGPEKGVREGFEQLKFPYWDRIQIFPADETISMEEHGAVSIRKKKGSTIHVGLDLIKEGKASAFISAGNSGAVMAGAALLLGRLDEVERPGILVQLPTVDGSVILVDGGANVDCKAKHLMQFAEMGQVYAKVVEGIANPRVALLSNGSEEHKGNGVTREAHALLKERTDLNFRGYVEGFDVFKSLVDVIACDGFVGNVVLKTAEGLGDTVFQWFKKEVKRDLLGLVGVLLMKRILQKFRNKFDYQPYGAAPLLGIHGNVFIAHGSASEVAICNGILKAKKSVVEKLNEKMQQSLSEWYSKAKP